MKYRVCSEEGERNMGEMFIFFFVESKFYLLISCWFRDIS